MRYTITVDEEQLRLINVATEEYMRIRLGQFSMVADSLAFMDFDFSNPDHGEAFNDAIERRNRAEEVFDSAYRIATATTPTRGITVQSEDAQMAYEVHQAIRHKLWQDHGCTPEWCVDGYSYMPCTDHPMPIVERIEDE